MTVLGLAVATIGIWGTYSIIKYFEDQEGLTMIGDFILWLKEVWKENTCIHEYEPFGIYKSFDIGPYEKCKKCGRLR